MLNPCTNKKYTRGSIDSVESTITIVVSSYRGYNEIRCIIYSFLCQKLSNCIHNHEIPFSSNGSSYGMLIPKLQQDHIDLGQYAIKTSILKQIKFNENNPAADGELISKVKERKSKYINKCLFVHN